ncbi:diadenylate cyclase CdaA [Chlamydiifrater volucris]|uniref:diadenylate cyclase CdaA n=1 Tax=Chlamydiifrater volucris TaxID=2681470 RepID=UPI001FE79E6B|nr:diadenylate cyclase CdaA [Chlamydiifrater volucris]
MDVSRLIPLAEITLIWALLHYLLKFFWGTRAMDVVFGFLFFLFLFVLSDRLNFPVINKLMLNVVNIAAIAVFIIFQPEIRLALSRIRIRGRKYNLKAQDHFIEQITNTVYYFSERQIGALIVLENKDSFNEYLNLSSVTLNADFSEELLKSIFEPSSPLHDGAVIIRGEVIAYARVILPLAQDTAQLSRTMGTRHRAALGASQKTDALIITVSEENGNVSLSRDGLLTRGVKMDRFRAVLRSLFAANKNRNKSYKSWLSF